MTQNKLKDSVSPYLRSAAHQPIDWYEWGEEAFRKARTEDKPLLWSAKEDWQDSQDLLQKYANMPEQADIGKYYTNEYLSDSPYMAKK